MADGKWVCDLCGSNQVQGKLWVNLNTKEIDDDIKLCNTLFCKACEEMTTVHWEPFNSKVVQLGKRKGK
jgi:hypothetical protein